MRLRCWARSGETGEFCPCDANHSGVVHGRNEGDLWFDSACPVDARALGRETAALRILEVSHEVDRLAFVNGHHSAHAERLRGIAARLMVDTVAACVDLGFVEREVAFGESLIAKANAAGDKAEHMAEFRWLEQGTALFAIAADLLRPFAEGT